MVTCCSQMRKIEGSAARGWQTTFTRARHTSARLPTPKSFHTHIHCLCSAINGILRSLPDSMTEARQGLRTRLHGPKDRALEYRAPCLRSQDTEARTRRYRVGGDPTSFQRLPIWYPEYGAVFMRGACTRRLHMKTCRPCT